MPGPAADALRKAIALEPEHAIAHYYLGEALNQARDLAGARTALEKAGQLLPDARTFRLLGRVYDRLGKPDLAQEMYQRAREVGEG
jgi:uncharacterized protein HemY